MNKYSTFFVLVGIFFLSLVFVFPRHIHANPPDELYSGESYVRAKVLQVINQGIQVFEGTKTYSETLKVQLLEGAQKGKIVTVGYGNNATFGVKEYLGINSIVVIDIKPDANGQMYYSFYEPYSLNNLWWILAVFAFIIVTVAGRRGVGAIIGLVVSLSVILFYIVPQIIKGGNPLYICILGSIFILFVTTYIAHGISLKTSVAIISTAISLVIAAFISLLFVHLTYLLGLGDQSAYVLQIASTAQINTQGILLGGIIIGTLGALNDITTTQSITIFTLVRENSRRRFSHLFYKSLSIGREHIASLINTLVLAYAGSSLAIFLFFVFNPAKLPWWLILNDPATMEEIIRALAGSVSLILAVPIVTLIACYVSLNQDKLFAFFKKNK